MYECENCGAVFAEPITVCENHGFTYAPYERTENCPSCRVAGMFVEMDSEDG